jgi:GT2 family glycosyltransferase
VRSPRPPVAVVVPFYGSTQDARELREALGRLDLGPGDEVTVADNTEDGRFGPSGDGVAVVRADLERSSYYARNVGAEATSAPWLLFIDSDTRPAAGLVDAYFAAPVADEVGILAGGVRASGDQTSTIARYAASRGHIDPSHYQEDESRRAAGITANLLVRRAAWEDVAGFHEGVRSGADLEFCWRVQDAGWRLEHRPDAWLEHEHVETLRRLARKAARHAGGGGWVNDRYPGAFRRPRLALELARSVVGATVWLVTRQPERALFKLIDGVFLTADAFGRLTDNRAKRDPLPPPRTVVVTPGAFPRAGAPETSAAASLDGGLATLRVVADRRAEVPARGVRRGLVIDYAEDEGWIARVRGLAFLLVRRPDAVLRVRRDGAGAPAVHRLAPAARRVAAWEGATIRPLTPAATPAAQRLADLSGRPLGAPVVVHARAPVSS